MSKTVVVLGAGVGGLSVASRLREQLPEKDRILLLDRSFDATLGLSLLWVMRGWRTPENVRVRPTPAALPGVEMVTTTVEAIEPQQRRVLTEAGEIRYDALVIALGADLAPRSVPGLAEAIEAGQAEEFYTTHGARSLHQGLLNLRQGRLAVLIAGLPFKCPAAPFEAALLAADLLRETGAREHVRVDTLTPDPLPMPVAGPVVGQALVGMLSRYDIGFLPQRGLERVEGENRRLVFTDGSQEDYDLLAVVPPHRPPAAVVGPGLGTSGWIPVDARTLTTDHEGVWAIGDVTLLTLPNGKPLPKAAVFAEGEADVVAFGVARHLGYEAPTPWFTGFGSCYIELGDHVAAKGEGNFLEAPAPMVTLLEPSARFHQEKADQETDWIKRWNA
ncbi:NAD(P)/FAD-dependent oxidoreductase [Streptosporangium sp. OZ121]|uniref:NAD(P)/FAD-dependent oxidoreductase n=1 Tax=Streptosporangium sp. OZ121 TaxID=3444183 RepID=UPI003F795594